MTGHMDSLPGEGWMAEMEAQRDAVDRDALGLTTYRPTYAPITPAKETTPVYKQQGKEVRVVAEISEDGKKDVLKLHAVEIYGDYSWRPLAQAYGEEEITIAGQQFTALLIPSSKLLYAAYKKRPTVATCAFEATDRIMRTIHGASLDQDDRDWYVYHALTQEAGLPMDCTMRVLQELIEPYGFRVARIRAVPGVRILGDLVDWRDKYLGCNPLALTDRSTTNAEFCAATGYDPALAEKQFAFEYSSEPLRPAIVFESDAKSRAAQPMGHASFMGPRSKLPPQNIWISMQIARVDKEPWHYPAPKYEPLPSKEEIAEVDLYAMANEVRDTIFRQGPREVVVDRSPWPPIARPASAPPLVGSGAGDGTARREDGAKCELCKFGKRQIFGAVCADCWEWVWSSYKCHKCDVSLSATPPRFLAVMKKYPRFYAECAKCHAHLMLDAQLNRDDNMIRYMVFALRGVLTPEERHEYTTVHSWFADRADPADKAPGSKALNATVKD